MNGRFDEVESWSLIAQRLMIKSRKKWINVLALIGVALIVVGAVTTGELGRLYYYAKSRDDASMLMSALPCRHPRLSVIPEKRIMSEKESQIVTVIVRNTEPRACDLTIEFVAPQFDLGGAENKHEIHLNVLEERKITWIIAPKETGDYQLAVSSGLVRKYFGITVTNILGIPAFWAKIFAVIGGILGPMATLPWLLENVFGIGKAKSQNTL